MTAHAQGRQRAFARYRARAVCPAVERIASSGAGRTLDATAFAESGNPLPAPPSVAGFRCGTRSFLAKNYLYRPRTRAFRSSRSTHNSLAPVSSPSLVEVGRWSLFFSDMVLRLLGTCRHIYTHAYAMPLTGFSIYHSTIHSPRAFTVHY